MDMKEITTPIKISNTVCKITTEQLQRDYDYRRAQKTLQNMLDSGLISLVEFNKITELNRHTFSPFLVELMPKIR